MHSYVWPKDLVVHIIDYPYYVAVRFYRDNFEGFNGVDKEHIAKTVGEMIFAVRQKGCPCYLEVEAYAPKT